MLAPARIRQISSVSANTWTLLSGFLQDPKQGARVIDIPVAQEILGHLKSNGYDELDTARIVCQPTELL